MRRLTKSFAKMAVSAAILSATLASLPAHAQPPANNGGLPINPTASGPAQSTARLAALIAPGGNLVRSKNVASVTAPSTGITCIRPTAGAGINVARIVPEVTVEWGWSFGNSLMAFYFSNEPGFFSDCPAGNIEVRTYDLLGNLSDGVAFSISVD